MQPNRTPLRPDNAVLTRAATVAIILASLTALAFATVATMSEKAKAELAERYAKSLTARTVSSIDDLATFFKEQQALYLRITPPTPDFVFRQPCGVIPFDLKGFPDEFLKGLVEETDKGCPVYVAVVAEDSTTRETVFANAKGYEIHAIPAAKDYDPWWFLNSIYPDLYSGRYGNDQIEMMKGWYDPAHIQIEVKLLPIEYVDAYAAAMAEAYVPPSGGGTVLMRYNGPPVTNLQFTAIESLTNGMMLTLAYPAGFTNRVDFFTCTNLVDPWWDLVATTNVNSSTNWIEWLDTSPPELRFYAAGNADTNAETDPDGDGLTWAREMFMYHTSPTNSDSDNDGLNDYEEVINRRTDPNNSDTNLPTVSILFPSNGSEKVWLP
jgi:hypothetical protein